MSLEPVMPDKYVLRGGEVADGTGRGRFSADVVVEAGEIHLAAPGSTRGIHSEDVTGAVISPGFIDAHSHADLAAFFGSTESVLHESRLVQGVTTEVTGNCGFSPFPLAESRSELAYGFLSAVFGDSARTFSDYASYKLTVEGEGLASNVAPLVGHGALRVSEIGYEDRRCHPDEIERMRQSLAAALDAGAFGLSSGLVYTPATYAPSEELEQLAEVVAARGAIYASHVRNETDQVAEAIEEALTLSARVGVATHISHLKSAGERNWGRSGDLVGRLEEMRNQGVDVTADVYPYTSGSTMLHSMLPPWLADQGVAALLERVKDPDTRARAARDLVEGIPGWQNLGTATGWHGIRIAASPERAEWEGRSIATLAEQFDSDIVETISRVLETNRGKVVVVLDAMDEADVRTCMKWSQSMVGSDGIPLPGSPHPRLTGTFPRVLANYSGEDGLGSLEEAVRRMTGATAARFHIPRRGQVADGFIADLVVFDPSSVRDGSTYENPWGRPSGIHHVIMAGEPCVWSEEVVSSRAGRVLAR